MAEPSRAETVRMIEVAAAAGVSRSTVSNVMRGHSTVGPDIRDRVLGEAHRLGYVYDRGAAALRLRQSHLVGLVVPDLANAFIARATRGAHVVLGELGYLVATVESGEDVGRQAAAIRSLVEHRVDGLLVIPALPTGPEDLRAALGSTPGVVVNRDIGARGLRFTGPDDLAVADCGVSHLVLEHGCPTVAYFGGTAGARPRRDRAERFLSGSAAAGAEISTEWSVAFEVNPTEAYRHAAELLTTGPAPAGVMCQSDTVAFGLLRALREHGVSVQDCRVIGCDDLPESSLWNPGLSSVAVDAAAVGRSAARLLLSDLGADLTVEQHPVPAPRLVARESCGCHPLLSSVT